MAEALLIGLLVGIQRESEKSEKHAGLRDFIILGLAGGLCGLLQQAWLTVAALACATVVLGLFRFQHPERTGITTELSALATFLLAYMAGHPHFPASAQISIGLTILIAIFLEGKDALDRFFSEHLTQREFMGTLRFLALIFIIFPLLPEGAYGPYSFFSPRKVWMFVILVSSMSYVGYFLGKYFGGEHGLMLTSVLGGLASSTAATSALAKEAASAPAAQAQYSRAVVLANTVQLPRVFALISILNGSFAAGAAPAFLAMSLAGLAACWWVGRHAQPAEPGTQIETRNPFHITPALKFGALFAAMLLLTKWTTAVYGSEGIYWASVLGGSMDLDSVTVSLADLLNSGAAATVVAVWGVFFALIANAVVKTIIAFSSGVAGFGRNLLLGFAVMYAAGAIVLAAF